MEHGGKAMHPGITATDATEDSVIRTDPLNVKCPSISLLCFLRSTESKLTEVIKK